MDEKGRIAKAAGSMSVATLISRFLGYARDMLLAFYFGATGLSDTFFVAFRVPNLLRELFAEGSMSAAFVPVLTEYQTKDPAEAKRLVRVTFTFLLVAAGAVCVLGIIFAPQIVTVIAPGFLKSPDKFSLTVLLTRVMFPFLLFISLAALLMGALNVKRVFFVPALAPAMLNITIIATVVTLVPVLPTPILAVAAGVALGGLVQFAFQTPAFFHKGYSIIPAWNPRHPGLGRMLKLLLPVTLGMAVAQINIACGRKHHLPLLLHAADSFSGGGVRRSHGHGSASVAFGTCRKEGFRIAQGRFLFRPQAPVLHKHSGHGGTNRA
jgi:putative peptidoglycan lipid II flippase